MAFSYAGEDRPLVEPIAEVLARRWGRERVLYDKFHAAEFARPGLDVYLPPLYRDASELIVVVLSPDYSRKAWCGLELRWIRDLILEGDPGRILLLSLGEPGDLSTLGLLRGDGILNIDGLNAEAVGEHIEERLTLQGVGRPGPAAQKPSGKESAPWWRRRRPRALALAAALVLPLGWLAARGPLARWQMRQGDEAFRAFAQVPNEERLERAGAAWRRARQLDPGLAAAHARLGFLADFLNDPAAAEVHWTRAIEHEPAATAAARAYRTGLAHGLARQPARRAEAVAMYEADVLHPRSAIELAMLRWDQPATLVRSADALTHPELTAALAGRGSDAEPPWGFTMPNGEVLLFLNRGEQRCLLGAVRATTAQLLGAQPGSTGAGLPAASQPLASADCQGVRVVTRELLCDRLQRAAANPRASTARTWLQCPASPPPGQSIRSAATAG